MKKLVFNKEKEEKDKRMKTWLTVFIVGIMALSTAGFVMNFVTPSEKVTYNGLRFIRTDQGWQPKGYSINTIYLPHEVENITSEGNFVASDFNSKAYLIAAPYLRNNAAELIKWLPLTSLQTACLPEDENVSYCSDFVLKSCEDADQQNRIIIFKESNQTSIKYSPYCLQIEGDTESLTKASDKAVFMAYGIIK